MVKNDIYKRRQDWVIETWRIDDDAAFERVYYSQPNRIFILEPIFPPNVKYYYANAKRYELREEWASFENPDYLIKGRNDAQVGRDKVVRIASFDNLEEARFVLRLLVAVLNAHADDLLCREISPLLMKKFASFPTELEKVDMQEEKEEEEHAAKLKAEQAQREIEQYKKDAKKNLRASLCGGDYVYVFELEFGVIKIGHSTNVSRRISEVQSGGLNVIKACGIKLPTTTQACQLEKNCHQHFAAYKKTGQREYFLMPYEEACTYLRSLASDNFIIIKE